MSETKSPYGPVTNTEQIGRLLRAHRKQRGLTLDTVSGLGNVGMRFLSELERGKETAEIGKVLHVLGLLGLEIQILPRSMTDHGPTVPLSKKTNNGHGGQ